MSTSGFFGWVVDGKEYITYNHSDSHPGGLGEDVLKWLHDADHQAMADRVRALTLVKANDEPTPERAKDVARWSDLHVNSGRGWYAALRLAQGNLEAVLTSGYLIDNHEFPLESLLAEWGYMIDLDAQTFDVYQGFQKTAPKHGRWAGLHPEGKNWAAVERVASWPLTGLPPLSSLSKLEEDDEEDS